ncbi:MAG: GlsB/YeaQ/YmgE family stress response membrane protein [Gemmatimonadota bacterium]
MGILSWVLLGLIAGALAKWIMPGKDPGGLIVTILLGIAGAVIGGFIGSLLGLGSVTGFNLGSFVLAVLGALGLLWVYRRMKTGGTRAPRG